MRPRNRDYVADYLQPGEDDRGANDEGYYYFDCEECGERTEHENGSCCKCGAYNDPDFMNY